MSTSLFALLVNNPCLMDQITCDWLEVADIMNLVESCPGPSTRGLLTKNLPEYRFRMPKTDDRWHENSMAYLRWLADHDMKLAFGHWALISDDLRRIRDSGNPKLLAILEEIRSLTLKVPSADDMRLLNATMPELRTLEIFSLSGSVCFEGARPPLHLQTVKLYRCDITRQLADFLNNCPSLTSLHIKDATRADSIDEELLSEVLARINTLVIEGCCDAFLKVLFTRWNRLERLVIDNCNAAGTEPIDISQALKMSPALLSLRIARARIDMPTILVDMEVLRENRMLKTLELINVKFCPTRLAYGTRICCSLTHLTVERPQSAPHIVMGDLMRHAVRSVEHLQLSFCSKFVSEDYEAIVASAHSMRHLSIYLSEKDCRDIGLQTLESACAVARSLSITTWPHDVRTVANRDTDMSGSTVKIER